MNNISTFGLKLASLVQETFTLMHFCSSFW